MQKRKGDMFSIHREILANSKQRMLEGVTLTVSPACFQILCRSLLKCAACPMLVLSSPAGLAVVLEEVPCSSVELTVPEPGKLPVCCKPPLASPAVLFFHLRSTPPVGSFPFTTQAGFDPEVFVFQPHFCQHKL